MAYWHWSSRKKTRQGEGRSGGTKNGNHRLPRINRLATALFVARPLPFVRFPHLSSENRIALGGSGLTLVCEE